MMCSAYGRMRNAYKIFVGKSQTKREREGEIIVKLRADSNSLWRSPVSSPYGQGVEPLGSLKVGHHLISLVECELLKGDTESL
jgi:hypothetical protein